MATPLLKSTAAFRASDKVKAVLPIAGRAATIIKSDFCQPPVTRSRLLKPEGHPVNESSCFLASSISFMVALNKLLISL